VTTQDEREGSTIMEDEGSWSRWEKFVLAELKALRADSKETSRILIRLNEQFARFDEKAKASGRLAGAIWGMISGVAVVVLSEAANHGLFK
jgi:hypothetical protein